MDQNFQTSFIPKKPVVRESSKPRKSVGIFFVLSFLVFLSIIVAYGGIFVYKNNLNKSVLAKQKALDLARNRFEPGRLAQLQVLDKRINATNAILSQHISLSPVFSILEKNTMKTVRYTNFSYEMQDAGSVIIKLSGEANGYRSIALQADLLSQNKDLIDPVFSNLALDSKGNVLFDLTFSVTPELITYKANLDKGVYQPEPIIN